MVPHESSDAMLGMAHLGIFGCVWRLLGAYSGQIGPYLVIFGYLEHPKIPRWSHGPVREAAIRPRAAPFASKKRSHG